MVVFVNDRESLSGSDGLPVDDEPIAFVPRADLEVGVPAGTTAVAQHVPRRWDLARCVCLPVAPSIQGHGGAAGSDAEGSDPLEAEDAPGHHLRSPERRRRRRRSGTTSRDGSAASATARGAGVPEVRPAQALLHFDASTSKPVEGSLVRSGTLFMYDGEDMQPYTVLVFTNGFFVVSGPSLADYGQALRLGFHQSFAWSPFTEFKCFEGDSLSAFLGAFEDIPGDDRFCRFSCNLFSQNAGLVFATCGADRFKERASWVSTLKQALQSFTRALFPAFKLVCQPLPDLPSTSSRLLAGYLLRDEGGGTVCVPYCELHAHQRDAAALHFYEKEDCRSLVGLIHITALTVLSPCPVQTNCFQVDGSWYCARSIQEKDLWFRALNNIQVKLLHHAPDPGKSQLRHWRKSVAEKIAFVEDPRLCRMQQMSDVVACNLGAGPGAAGSSTMPTNFVRHRRRAPSSPCTGSGHSAEARHVGSDRCARAFAEDPGLKYLMPEGSPTPHAGSGRAAVAAGAVQQDAAGRVGATPTDHYDDCDHEDCRPGDVAGGRSVNRASTFSSRPFDENMGVIKEQQEDDIFCSDNENVESSDEQAEARPDSDADDDVGEDEGIGPCVPTSSISSRASRSLTSSVADGLRAAPHGCEPLSLSRSSAQRERWTTGQLVPDHPRFPGSDSVPQPVLMEQRFASTSRPTRCARV